MFLRMDYLIYHGLLHLIGTGHGVNTTRNVVMYFHGLSNDEILSKKRFESYEESCKQSQIRMVTLFGQKVKIPGFNYMFILMTVTFVLKRN